MYPCLSIKNVSQPKKKFVALFDSILFITIPLAPTWAPRRVSQERLEESSKLVGEMVIRTHDNSTTEKRGNHGADIKTGLEGRIKYFGEMGKHSRRWEMLKKSEVWNEMTCLGDDKLQEHGVCAEGRSWESDCSQSEKGVECHTKILNQIQNHWFCRQ